MWLPICRVTWWPSRSRRLTASCITPTSSSSRETATASNNNARPDTFRHRRPNPLVQNYFAHQRAKWLRIHLRLTALASGACTGPTLAGPRRGAGGVWMPNALAAKYLDVKTTRIDTHVLNREPMGAVGLWTGYLCTEAARRFHSERSWPEFRSAHPKPRRSPPA